MKKRLAFTFIAIVATAAASAETLTLSLKEADALLMKQNLQLLAKHYDVNMAVGTVSHNLVEGILLVTFIVLIFMADWRTTLAVSVVIPLALHRWWLRWAYMPSLNLARSSCRNSTKVRYISAPRCPKAFR